MAMGYGCCRVWVQDDLRRVCVVVCRVIRTYMHARVHMKVIASVCSIFLCTYEKQWLVSSLAAYTDLLPPVLQSSLVLIPSVVSCCASDLLCVSAWNWRWFVQGWFRYRPWKPGVVGEIEQWTLWWCIMAKETSYVSGCVWSVVQGAKCNHVQCKSTVPFNPWHPWTK